MLIAATADYFSDSRPVQASGTATPDRSLCGLDRPLSSYAAGMTFVGTPS